MANCRLVGDLVGQADQQHVAHQDVQAVDTPAVVAVEHAAPGIGDGLGRGRFAHRVPHTRPHVGASECRYRVSQIVIEGLGQVGLDLVAKAHA
ncbi:hypothetical protein D3C81_637280 [compost metagenome]